MRINSIGILLLLSSFYSFGQRINSDAEIFRIDTTSTISGMFDRSHFTANSIFSKISIYGTENIKFNNRELKKSKTIKYYTTKEFLNRFKIDLFPIKKISFIEYTSDEIDEKIPRIFLISDIKNDIPTHIYSNGNITKVLAQFPTGKCYAKCLIQDKYETITEQILVKEATTRAKIIPPKFETISEKVLVKDSYKRIDILPKKYQTVTENIEIAPSSTKWVKIIADRNCLSSNPDSCLVWTLVEKPAQYKTIIKKIDLPCAEGYLNKGDDCIQIDEIPAVYQTVEIKKIKEDARVEFVEVPAEWSTVSKRVITKPGGYSEWRQVVCSHKIDSEFYQELKAALQKKGFQLSDKQNSTTEKAEILEALIDFQRLNFLPLGQFDFETIRALGISLNK